MIKKMTDNITIRLLTPSDIYPEMLESFNRKQIISDKWVKNGNCYELIKTDEIRDWSGEKKIWISQYLCQQINSGGYAAGAFSDHKLVGFSCLDGAIQGISEKYVNLTMLFVDDEWKRKGIGKKLFKQMCLCAERMKADKIFISAIPSYDTVSFYLNLGCVDAKYVIDSFVDTENDRYLEYNLKRD